MNNHIKSIVRKMLTEAMKDTFSYETLSSLNSYKKRVQYCKSQLGTHIGSGSSRMVFQLDDETCLKLAKNEKGIAQNEAEYDWYADKSGVIPQLKQCAQDYSWIVVEYVLPAKKQDFQHCLGISFETYCDFVRKVYSLYARPTHYNRNYSNMSEEEYERLINNDEWLSNMADYLRSSEPPLGDLLRLANYGLANRDGEATIVLLDNGLTQQVWDDYYARR